MRLTPLEILKCSSKQQGVVAELAYTRVAAMTQETANLSRIVVMVHMKALSIAVWLIRPADRTSAALFLEHPLVIFKRHAKLLLKIIGSLVPRVAVLIAIGEIVLTLICIPTLFAARSQFSFAIGMKRATRQILTTAQARSQSDHFICYSL
jgi:hypothetical protein